MNCLGTECHSGTLHGPQIAKLTHGTVYVSSTAPVTRALTNVNMAGQNEHGLQKEPRREAGLHFVLGGKTTNARSNTGKLI